MDIEDLRKILENNEKYRIFALSLFSNERHYGNEYRECVNYVLSLLEKLIYHFGTDFEEELSQYYEYVTKRNEDYRVYLKTGQYKYSKIADVERSEEWHLQQKKYPFILLFSVVLATHRFEIYNYLRKSLEPYLEKGGSCLEVGTGCGLDAEFLSKHFALTTYDTSDISAECIKILFPSLKGSFRHRMCDFQEVESYDLGVMIELVEHLEDPLGILRKFYRVIKPKSIGFITFAIRMPQIDHVYHFGTVDEAKKMLDKSRFKIIDEYYAVSSLSYIPKEDRAVYASNPKYSLNYCCLVKRS